MAHYETMSERICKDLREIVLASTINTPPFKVKDFAIVTEERGIYNKSPILFQEAHLGLEAWSVDIIYQYVCSKIFPLRKHLARGKTSLQERRNLNCWLIAAILINPQVTTFWNMRRNLALQAAVAFSVELEFSRIVLTRNYKSSDAFTYRRWVLQRMFLDETARCVVFGVTRSLFYGELQICDKVLELAPDNYHCWIHRQCCMVIFDMKNVIEDTLREEFKFIDLWVQRHTKISNGYHYKQFLINFVNVNKRYGPQSSISFVNNSVIVPRSACKSVEDGKINIDNFWEQLGNNDFYDCSKTFNMWICVLWNDLANEDFKDKLFYMHENFWLHRRFILYMMFSSIYYNLGGKLDVGNEVIHVKSTLRDPNILFTVSNSNYKVDEPIFINHARNKIITSPFYKALISAEKKLVQKLTFPSNHELIRRHCSWLNNFLRFDVELTSDS
ncbi:hypothetical protein HUJ04_006736 [Dendroctonus ponderosae]|uniref:Protein prenyltransferase alpha subunit repeat-containing protein 1 n=3 Tax=Dendroctonus ponderosae TaxID=77166 RepID=A0AAR5Q3Q1_DENPD|nr:hypothetical protein HUJ04_006736 [Dendroctonus ponderosae]